MNWQICQSNYIFYNTLAGIIFGQILTTNNTTFPEGGREV